MTESKEDTQAEMIQDATGKILILLGSQVSSGLDGLTGVAAVLFRVISVIENEPATKPIGYIIRAMLSDDASPEPRARH